MEQDGRGDSELLEESVLARLGPRALLGRGLCGEESPQPALSMPFRVPPTGTASQTPRHPGSGLASKEFLEQVFPEYRIGGQLGGGGFGSVFRAEHRTLKRGIALKILSNTLTCSPAGIARFEREIEALGKLDDVRLVRAFDGGQRQGIWFLAMELVEGVDFGALSRVIGLLEPSDACELARQVALALQHAHGRGLLHRDIKPGNLMLARTREGGIVVKVLDFGLACLVHGDATGAELTLSGDFVGTLDYAAPEQIKNPRTADARADIYGLGATLYRLLCGCSPHGAGESSASLFSKLMRIATEDASSIALRRSGLNPDLVTLVDRMVARDPSKRFDSAEEVSEALAPFCVGSDLRRLLGLAEAAAPPLPELPPERLLVSRSQTGFRPRLGWLMVPVACALALWMILGRWNSGANSETGLSPDSTNVPMQPPRSNLPKVDPIPIPGEAYAMLMVDSESVVRVMSPDWKYFWCCRLGTPRSAQFHPETGEMFFCAGRGEDSSVCSMEKQGFHPFKRRIGGVGANTLAMATDGDSVVWSDAVLGVLRSGSIRRQMALATHDHRGTLAQGFPLGIALPGAHWQGKGYSSSDGLMVDGGTNGTKGVWRFSIQGGTPKQIVRNLELLDQPVDITFGRKDIHLVNRIPGLEAMDAAVEAEFRRRVYRLANNLLVPCTTDQPITDPCAIASDPLTEDLYVYCGRQWRSERFYRRLVRLRRAASPNHFTASEVFSGFRIPTISGVDISPDGQWLMLTEEGGPGVDMSFIYLFQRRSLTVAEK